MKTRLPLHIVVVTCFLFAIHNIPSTVAQPNGHNPNPSDGRQRENPSPSRGRPSTNTNTGQVSPQQKNKPLPMPPKNPQPQTNKLVREPPPPLGLDNGPRPQPQPNVAKLPERNREINMPVGHAKPNAPVHPVISVNDAQEISQKVHAILEESVKSHPHPHSATHMIHSKPQEQNRQSTIDFPTNIEQQRIEERDESKFSKFQTGPDPINKESSPSHPVFEVVASSNANPPPHSQLPVQPLPPPPLNNMDQQFIPIPDHIDLQPFPTNIRNSPIHVPNNFQDPPPPAFVENHMKSEMQFEQQQQFKDDEQQYYERTQQHVMNDNVPLENFLEPYNDPLINIDINEPILNGDDAQESLIDIHMEATNQIIGQDRKEVGVKKGSNLGKNNPDIADLPPYKFQDKKVQIQQNDVEEYSDTTFSKSDKSLCVHGLLLNICMILILINI